MEGSVSRDVTIASLSWQTHMITLTVSSALHRCQTIVYVPNLITNLWCWSRLVGKRVGIEISGITLAVLFAEVMFDVESCLFALTRQASSDQPWPVEPAQEAIFAFVLCKSLALVARHLSGTPISILIESIHMQCTVTKSQQIIHVPIILVARINTDAHSFFLHFSFGRRRYLRQHLLHLWYWLVSRWCWCACENAISSVSY